MRNLYITSEYIRLDAALKLGNLVSSGGMAKIMIQDGFAKVNGEVCTARGKKLFEGDEIEFNGEKVKISYRGE